MKKIHAAINLRHYMRDMTEGDLKAIYHYVRAQPVAGEPAPAYVRPGQEPKTPYAQFPAPPK